MALYPRFLRDSDKILFRGENIIEITSSPTSIVALKGDWLDIAGTVPGAPRREFLRGNAERAMTDAGCRMRMILEGPIATI
jgi:hypothetical protein